MLFAVNSTQQHVKGITCWQFISASEMTYVMSGGALISTHSRWQFTIRKMVSSAYVIVSADIDEVILGVCSFKENNFRWLFDRNVLCLCIDGKLLSMV